MTIKKMTIIVGSLLTVFAIVTVGEAVTSKLMNNNLKLYGKAFNPQGYFTVADDMVITELLDVKGNVSDSNGNLTLDDTVAVTGDLIVEGGAEVKGAVYNSNDAVTVNDDLAVTGALSINTMVTPTTNVCETDGVVSYDASYLYLCVDGTWKKVTLQNM
jgi:hypothetical protein